MENEDGKRPDESRHWQMNLKVPAVWKELIKREFPKDLKGMKSGKCRTEEDDPEAYYDDDRYCYAYFYLTPGNFVVVLQLSLCSGQRNYFGTVQWYNEWNEPIGRGIEPFESFEDSYHLEYNKDHYQVNIIWEESK